MGVRRLFTDQDLCSDSPAVLEPGPSHHIAKVLRMAVGDSLCLFNGRGGEFSAAISAVEKKSVSVLVGDHVAVERESALRLVLGVAISRGDRMDWVIQKATEIGVASIAPLLTERTEVKLRGDRATKKLLHWRQIIVSACEQCGRNRLPEIFPPTAVDSWLPAVHAERKFVLHHRDSPVEGSVTSPASAALLVGPEGGLSSAEIARCENAGFEPLTLGPRVMRTETAPLAALAILQARWGDMGIET